jgi:hypothetical protein
VTAPDPSEVDVDGDGPEVDAWAREIVARMTPPDQATLDRLAVLMSPDGGPADA